MMAWSSTWWDIASSRLAGRLGNASVYARGPRRWWRPALEAVVAAAVIASATGITLYMYGAVNRVRDRLPAQIVAQQRDVATMVHDFADLVRAVEGAGAMPEAERAPRLLAHIRASREHLATIRRSYNFDNLVGASAMHALVNPALQDMERWLTDGLYDHTPASSTVLGLVQLRAAEAYAHARSFFDASNDRAAELIGAETAQLARLRDSLAVYMGVFAAFAVGVLAPLIAQRNVRTRLAVARGRLSDSIENLSEGFALFDPEDRLVVCNQRYRELYDSAAHMMQPGMPFEDLIRATWESGSIQGIAGASPDYVGERLARRRGPAKPFELEMRDGRTIRVSEYRTAEGGSVGIHADITDLIRIRERLEHLATHDLVTGLPNRSFYQDRLAQAIARAERRDGQVAVLFLDLDRCKLVNDTYGHAGGDALLAGVAELMRECLRESDTVARLGGDEFGAVMEDIADFGDVAAPAAGAGRRRPGVRHGGTAALEQPRARQRVACGLRPGGGGDRPHRGAGRMGRGAGLRAAACVARSSACRWTRSRSIAPSSSTSTRTRRIWRS